MYNVYTRIYIYIYIIVQKDTVGTIKHLIKNHKNISFKIIILIKYVYSFGFKK